MSLNNHPPPLSKKDEAIIQYQKELSDHHLIRTCGNCTHVDLKQNQCLLFKQTPPIAVCVVGCPHWESDLPF